jgi:hypothetical protein
MNSLGFIIGSVYSFSIIYLGLGTLGVNNYLERCITFTSKLIKRNYHLVLAIISLIILSPLIALYGIVNHLFNLIKWLGKEI